MGLFSVGVCHRLATKAHQPPVTAIIPRTINGIEPIKWIGDWGLDENKFDLCRGPIPKIYVHPGLVLQRFAKEDPPKEKSRYPSTKESEQHQDHGVLYVCTMVASHK